MGDFANQELVGFTKSLVAKRYGGNSRQIGPTLTAILPSNATLECMGSASKKAWIGLAALQGGLALAAILILALTPPPLGRYLLVPLNGQPISDTLLQQQLLDRRGPGPLPGSVIADGYSAGVAEALGAHGILMLAAPALICGHIERA